MVHLSMARWSALLYRQMGVMPRLNIKDIDFPTFCYTFRIIGPSRTVFISVRVTVRKFSHTFRSATIMGHQVWETTIYEITVNILIICRPRPIGQFYSRNGG